MKTMEATHLLKTYRDVVARLQNEATVPTADAASSDFLDLAQSVERQELARLTTTRLAEQARRLHIALTRVADGECGICSECGAPFRRNAFAPFPMPPHAWRVRRGSNTRDPGRRGAPRDCRAPEFVPGRHALEMGDKTQLVALSSSRGCPPGGREMADEAQLATVASPAPRCRSSSAPLATIHGVRGPKRPTRGRPPKK